MLSSLLLSWYEKNKRSLPWREHPDPYAVWVSEIMLQQTRVETVIPYFERCMARFPSIASLAAASEQDVLNLWEGLGYYSRARNLHKAAVLICRDFDGRLPANLDDLRKLPGIGRYTAGAIASIAFGLDEPALDGNIRRVYARLFDVAEPADSPVGQKTLWDLAHQHLPPGRAADYNQALMDLGSAICLPRNPRCLICPLSSICAARAVGTQDLRPVLKPRKETPHVVHAAAVIVSRGRVLLVRRPSAGLLGGMWEFPNAQVHADPAGSIAGAISSSYGLEILPGSPLLVIDHAYTHFKVTTHAFRCELLSPIPPGGLKWIAIKKLEDFPMGRIDRQIARKLA
jgi:A/G-specific adenine glycosylase